MPTRESVLIINLLRYRTHPPARPQRSVEQMNRQIFAAATDLLWLLERFAHLVLSYLHALMLDLADTEPLSPGRRERASRAA